MTIGIAARNGAYGLSSTKRTVLLSSAVTLSGLSTGLKAPDGALPIASTRLKL